MRPLLSLLTAATLLLVGFQAVAQATPYNGAVLITCNRATAAQADPIVSFGVSPSDHNHVFWGSSAAGASTTLPQMLTGTTSCDVKSDKSLYWHPTITAADGHTVLPGRSSFYYRAAARGGAVHTFPMGMRFVWGDHNNMSQYTSAAHWQCADAAGSGPYLSIPASCGGYGVQETMFIGSCWDGLDLGPGGGGHDNVPASQHVSGVVAGNVCPADHPIRLPALQFVINWPADAPGGRLSSDMIGADPGASAHADVFIAWTLNSQDHDALAAIVDQCLNVDSPPGTVSCQQTSDGRVVKNDGTYVTD